tara:strand:- start:5938 stop:7569 length:1632 start_codon:yes stop_codon:yes gene_type:complete
MSNVSNLLNDAQNTYRQQINETKAYVSKWEKTGLLEGIEAEYEKHNTAILLENQARQLIQEANATGTGGSKEEWSGVALPLVRRIFGEIAAKDFVSVQPMNLPSGLVFFLDFKYGSNSGAGGTTSGNIADGDKIMGVTDTKNTDPSGGLYGAGRFGYSTNRSASTGIAGALTAASTASIADVGFDSTLATLVTAKRVKKVVITTGNTNLDEQAAQAFQVSASDFVLYPQFTTATSAGVVTFIGSTAAELPTWADTFGFDSINTSYVIKNANDQSRGDFEDKDPTSYAEGTATDLNIPEVNVELRSEAIIAKTRKLKVIWTPEFAQDLNAYHSIDAEAELTSMLSEYISMEIDLEILSMLSANANTTDSWSAAGQALNAAGTAFADVGSMYAYQQTSWFATLGTKVQKVSNKIHAKTMRGGANFLVCGPDVSTVLESISGFGVDTDGAQQSFAMGVTKIGSLANRFTVYKNPYMQSNEIIMGFRGTQFLETGAVYAPYIPLIMTPLVYDPTNFTPRKGVMTRYAKKVVRPEFYGKINVTGLNTI